MMAARHSVHRVLGVIGPPCDDLITQAEAGRILGVKPGRVPDLIASGELPTVDVAVVVPMVRRADVDRLIGRPKRKTGVPRGTKMGPRKRPNGEGAPDV